MLISSLDTTVKHVHDEFDVLIYELCSELLHSSIWRTLELTIFIDAIIDSSYGIIKLSLV